MKNGAQSRVNGVDPDDLVKSLAEMEVRKKQLNTRVGTYKAKKASFTAKGDHQQSILERLMASPPSETVSPEEIKAHNEQKKVAEMEIESFREEYEEAATEIRGLEGDLRCNEIAMTATQAELKKFRVSLNKGKKRVRKEAKNIAKKGDNSSKGFTFARDAKTGLTANLGADEPETGQAPKRRQSEPRKRRKSKTGVRRKSEISAKQQTKKI